MKTRLGIVCALAGVLAVSAGVPQASATTTTLNGMMDFATRVTFGGGTDLASATWIAIPATATVEDQWATGVNGNPNDFLYNAAHPWSFQPGSLVHLNTGIAGNHLTTAAGGGTPPAAGFLTFAMDNGTAKGTIPSFRFTYDLAAATWFTSPTAPDKLEMDSIGFLTDTGIPGFLAQPSVLTLSITTNCDNIAHPACNFANAAWEFSTDGTGGYTLTPEPAALSVLGMGLVGLAMVRRRRR